MADNGEGSTDPQITFKVKTGGDSNKIHTVTIAESATVLDLKTKLSGEDYENIAVDRQRLIYSGRVMKNDDALSTYKIRSGNTIHLVKSAASNPAASGTSASAPAPPAVPTNMAAGTSANNPLGGLTGARYAGHMPLPNQDIFGPDGGVRAASFSLSHRCWQLADTRLQMNLPSEDQVFELLSNPNVAQSMNEALNNPAFIDIMIQQNPQLRDNPHARQMLQSPQFRAMLTNPEALRMAARMRRLMASGTQNAFPAPGATDTTPVGAPASGGAEGTTGAQAQNPFSALPALLGLGGLGAAPGAVPGAGALANNPFLSMFGPPATGAAAPSPAAGNAQRDSPASPTAGTTGTGPAQGGAASQPPNPLAGLLGLTGQAGTPALSPEAVQQALQALGIGGMGGLGGLGGMGGMGGMGSPPPPADNRPPEERYADQLHQLNDMGFYDFDRNVAALRRSGGSVQGAIQELLGD